MFSFDARLRLHLGLCIVAASLLGIACGGCKPAPTAIADLPTPTVTVAPVVKQETVDADEYTGRTEASEIVEVRARVYGFLKTVDFNDGDFVKEGQLLFTIEPDEYQAIHQQSLQQIKLFDAKLKFAKANLARRAKLVTSGTVSREEYEESVAAVGEVEASIAAARADAARTALDLKYTEVRAPISGRIDRAVVSKGNIITGGQGSGTLLTKIVQEQPMYVYFDVDERSLLRYLRLRDKTRETAPGSLRELGLPIYLKLSDETEFTHEGQLDFASTEVNASTGTARIRGVFPNKNRELASGLFVRARIPIGKPYEALMIPEQAIATDQSVKFVYVVGDDGVATRRAVTLGRERGDMRIITAGLEAGQKVITRGLQRVRPGQKVDPELATPAAPVVAAATVAAETAAVEPAPTETSTRDGEEQ